jgi:MFS family permease
VINQYNNQHSKAEPRLFYGYIVVAASLLIMLLSYGSRLSFGVFFKPMISEFHWTRALISGAITLAMVTQGCWGILMGKLNDRFGPRLILTLCCFFLGLGFLLSSQINYSWQLYLFYGAITGFGMGGVFVALLSTVARWFVRRRGAMTGLVLTGIGLGTLVMTPVSNWLISIFDWRTSFMVVGGVVLIIGIIAAQFLRRDPASKGLVPYGKNQEEEQQSAEAIQGLSFKQAAGTRQFWMVSVSFFCLGYCIFAVNIHLVPHITDLGISATTAANVLAAAGGAQTLGGIVLGGAADRIGNRLVLVISFILISAGMLWLVLFNNISMFYLFAVVYGLGVGGGGTMEPTVIAELFGIKSHGLILGVTSFIFTVGGAIGPFVTGYIFDINGSYHLAFLICAAAGVVGLLLAATLRPVSKLSNHG